MEPDSIDLNAEWWRTYVYPGAGNEVHVVRPVKLYVIDGRHVVVTASGIRIELEPGWLCVKICAAFGARA